VPPAIAVAVSIAIVVLVLIAAITAYLRSYRPHRVPVVERARVPHDVRAKVIPQAMSRGLRRPRWAGWRRRSAGATVADVLERHEEVQGVEEITAPVSSVATVPPGTAPRATARTLVQPVLAHNLDGASRPGSYFRSVDAPSPETIISGERGPWAAPIVTEDGRITLPDSGQDVAVTWCHPEDTPPADEYLTR
jgi:hypothetical protein